MLIATIRKSNKYFAHYHTGGVPGRAEIDETQELNYKPIMEAILRACSPIIKMRAIM